MVFDVMRMISTQIRWQDPCVIALQVVRTSFGFHLREFMGSSSPPPPPLVFTFNIPVYQYMLVISRYRLLLRHRVHVL